MKHCEDTNAQQFQTRDLASPSPPRLNHLGCNTTEPVACPNPTPTWVGGVGDKQRSDVTPNDRLHQCCGMVYLLPHTHARTHSHPTTTTTTHNDADV